MADDDDASEAVYFVVAIVNRKELCTRLEE